MSPPIAWLFCTGPVYSDPLRQLQYKVEVIRTLKPGDIQTLEDAKAVQFLLGCIQDLQAQLHEDLLSRLQNEQPLFRPAEPLREAAE